MKKMLRFLTLVFLAVVFSVNAVWAAGTTGKIAGTITDKTTGEPLFGASVVVVGTTLGAATDMDGHFTILYVPPGTYSIQITFIGYNKTVVNDVRVHIDQTASVNATLEQQVIKVEELVVYADRTVIKKDVATSVTAVSDQEIKSLPITNIVSAIGLQAGVRGGWGSFGQGAQQPTFVNQNYSRGKVSVQGGLSIRGGEGDNILFMQDGITLRDPRNNEPISKLPLSSIKEVSIERGGFNAEYGQVRSGIINIVSKEGDKQGYSGDFQIRYNAPSPKYYKPGGSPNTNIMQDIFDIQDPNSFVLRPFFDPAVCWTGTSNGAWDEYMQNQYPRFDGWNKIAENLNKDNNPNNDLTPQGAQRAFEYETRKRQITNQPDFDIDAGFGGPVPVVGRYLGDLRFFGSYRSTREMLLFPMTRPDYRDYDINLQVISDLTPTMKLRLSGLMGKQYTMSDHWQTTGNYYYPRTPQNVADRISTVSSTSDLLQMFSDFYYSLADISHRSLAAKLTHTLGSKSFYEVSVEQFRREYNVRPTGLRNASALSEIIPGFYEDSNPFGYWPNDFTGVILTRDQQQHSARARDFTIVNSTTFKADFSSQIDFRNLVKGGIEFNYNDLNFDYGTIQSGGQATEKYNNRVQMHIFPIRAAIYAQDKVELQEFTINAGLRLDFSDSKVDWWNLDPYNVNFFLKNNQSIQYPIEKSKPQWQVSPRLGIAHPITENSKLFFNYGHFKQVPQYESIFRLQRNNNGSVSSFGNPNITLAKTISYELGFDYILFDDYLIQVAGFYNDITDQQDFTLYNSPAYGIAYNKSTSNNYEDTRGFELTIRKTAGRWWSGFVNYTYQVTTTGHFGSSQVFDDKTAQKQFDDATVNLYQNRQNPQPYARANVNFYTPEDFGPEILGHNILGGIGVNTTLDWQAGYWTAWNPGQVASVTYNVQALDYFNTYLRVDKNIDFGKFKVQLFVDINNVFNTLRLWNVQDYAYMSSLHFPKSKDYSNIPGDDKVGEYRKLGVDYQPMVSTTTLPNQGVPSNLSRAWYYLESTGKYYEWKNQQWSEVDQNRLNKVLDDKAYIDMPNASTYWFLDPRRIFFGLKLSFNFN